jgi:hypothetical protein
MNNPQTGSLTPEAFKDLNLNTTADPDAVSGYVSISHTAEIKLITRPLWTLADGSVVC